MRAAARSFVRRYIAEIERLGASALLAGQDVQIIRDGEAAEYAGKGSASWEVSGGEKSARSKESRTPWELAVLAAGGDRVARDLFLVYAKVMPGTRSCVVSASLAAVLGITANSDDDVPGEQQLEEIDAIAGHLPAPLWSRIWCRGKAAEVLSAVEKDRPWPEIEKLAQTLGAVTPPPAPPKEFADFDRIINTARCRGGGKSGAAAARELNRAVDEARALAERRGRVFHVDWAALRIAYVKTCAASPLN